MAKEKLDIEKALKEIGEKAVIDLGAELVLKGRTTDAKKSRLIADAEVIVKDGIIEIWMPSYWQYVEYGVAASNIPFTPGKRGGKKPSKYINALLNWLSTKGKDSNDPRTLGIAFAIATIQSRKGNPIDKNKLNFVSATIRKKESKWATDIEKIIGKEFEGVIFGMLDTAEQQIKI